ncbi:glycoside hydrolase family 2 protein [Sphingobacterium psychroaquaticum]|uniref:Glycosyl hydrolases family 2 n=1 Tax=Sphingobacterium psychroaquaticum TaxID=561061 RepID=A0A1X7J2E2_9SPHI|nr:sugar-binding domain-containing protein [Sphingobacterium psychroaquaticum]SMG21527.1 Glycosyl hydrolases family 2 [Sphingobacterium psychroaquaticum]
MKMKMTAFCLMMVSFFSTSGQEGNVVGHKIKTRWGETLDPLRPHQEYPRPQLERKGNWKNLNGKWRYTVVDQDQKEIPTHWDGDIVVPFAIESALSGVGKTVATNQSLWYQREISVDNSLRKGKVLLHFGAVDWSCDVYVNKQHIGQHEGGFDPFSFDITDVLKKGERQEIVVRVWDPTDDGPQPRGKQIRNPHGIWYTPVTGIWQTVWLEGVPTSYIAKTKQTPNVDESALFFSADIASARGDEEVVVEAYDGATKIGDWKTKHGVETKLSLPGISLWSPDHPKLYDLRVKLMRSGKVVDEVKSYFAMRKISMQKDDKGIQRMLLNNKFVFHYGPLDQGWWPDGLHTAPSDEALKFDIEKTKEMGFNMIRKHIKVEPARWYRYCDSIGILVWQDMPSGDLGGNAWDMHPGKISSGQHDKDRSADSEKMYRKEWRSIMDALHNFPSIVIWVPFNEAWGQFKTKEITDWTMKYDPSRLVNSASGGNFAYVGHILDLHNYPDAAMPDPGLFGKDFVLALGEFGGLGLPVEGHTWQQKDNWGYQSFKNGEELKKRYAGLVKDLHKLIPRGLSAAVYTQTTDVEIETNGLMTYDRKIIKIPVDELHEMHQVLYTY